MEEIAALQAQERGEALEIETTVPSAEPVDPPPKKKKYTSRGDLRREAQEDEDKAMKRQWKLAKKQEKEKEEEMKAEEKEYQAAAE